MINRVTHVHSQCAQRPLGAAHAHREHIAFARDASRGPCTRSFLRHHTQQLVKAAVVGDSEAILRKITTSQAECLRRRIRGDRRLRSRRGGLNPRAAALCACEGPLGSVVCPLRPCPCPALSKEFAVTVEHVASEWSVLLNWPACVLSVDTHMSMLGLLFVQVMQ